MKIILYPLAGVAAATSFAVLITAAAEQGGLLGLALAAASVLAPIVIGGATDAILGKEN